MDIRKWLDETVQPDLPPNLPKHPNVESSSRPNKPEPAPHRSKRQRRRNKSDSSLLDTPPQKEKPATKGKNPPTESGTGDSANSEPSQPTRNKSSKSDTSSQRYARKPRRKTRPERYEPSSNIIQERGKHAERSRKGESKKLLRKSKRKKGEKPGNGIAQSFHAKNVSGDRLTLKPREQLGIFNKGRTSMAVKGRGLPDLVFSEMKFLQKHQDQPEPALPPGVPKKKRKKDHTHSKEGEISAFFTSVRPALKEKEGNTLASEDQEKQTILPHVTQRERERSSVVDAAIPTIEMPDKVSYRGFGSRGPRHESTSYVSWSESVRAASTTPAQARIKTGVRQNQLDPGTCGGGVPTAHEDETSFKRLAPSPVTRNKSEVTAERFKVSSIAPSHHRVSRSHSYPQHPSSPRRVNLVDRAAKFQSAHTAGSTSSMPPFVSVRTSVDGQQVRLTNSYKNAGSRATSLSGTNILSTRRQPVSNEKENDLDMDQHTSSDLGKVLRQCKDTFHDRRRAATPRRRDTVRTYPVNSVNEPEQQTQTVLYPKVCRVSTAHFAGVESQVPTLRNFAGPSIYEQQAQRQPLPLQPIVEENSLEGHCHIGQDYLDENDGVYYENQSWEGLLREPASYELEGEFGGHSVEEGYDDEVVAQHLVSENNVVAPGFWRPNRLY